MSVFDKYEVVIGNTNDEKISWSIDFKKGICKTNTDSGTHSFKIADYKNESDKEVLINFAINEFQGVSNIEDWILEEVENLKDMI